MRLRSMIQMEHLAFKIYWTYFSGSLRKPKKTHWRMEEYRLPSIVTWTMISREKNWYWEESNEARVIFLGCNY
ncbi:hypothetical protein CK203_038890 [Vitis vinifera]|uniref:Uncharacterized protein n=1 Tax=Vitis vinifera TaxID=29760 RepID=A0A438HFV6_VITVI|nr:hypothetical protein CK203_038890 [Vitis vinifera]